MLSYRRFFELFWILTRRELKIRYAQTMLGFFWSVFPVLTYLGIYTLFFSIVIKIETGGLPYPLLALTGIMGWNLFRETVQSGGSSLIAEAEFIKKNQVPKIIVPLYKSASGLVEFTTTILLLFLLKIIYQDPISVHLLWLPLIVGMNFLAGLGIALWTSLLSIRIRDFFHLIQAGINVLFWFTPVFYLPELIPEPYRFVLFFNPMAGIISCYRWSLLGGDLPSPYYGIGMVIALILLVTGIRRFRKDEKYFPDYL